MEWFPPLVMLSAFFIGGIPFGVLFAKMFCAKDPRNAGSRNIGFTNVLRVCGKKVGILTLAGDFGKGYIVGWIAGLLWGLEFWTLVSGFSVIAGHMYSPFLRFRGGKGVATGLGCVLGLHPMIGLMLIGIWLSILAIWKYSSGAAIITFGIFPMVSVLLVRESDFFVFSLLVSGIILYRHKENIFRLVNGTESRMGHKAS